MKNKFAIILAAFVFGCVSFANDKAPVLIFEDNFERSESQETKDEVGEGWSSNSEKETKGKSRQFDIKDGALHVFRYEGTKHLASIKRSTDFKDGTFEVRFQLIGDDDSFEVTFIDPEFKGSKNGMLFEFAVGTKGVSVSELKTGQDLRKAAKTGAVTPKQQKELGKMVTTFPAQLETGKWYSFLAKISGGKISILIDEKKLARLNPKASRIRKKAGSV